LNWERDSLPRGVVMQHHFHYITPTGIIGQPQLGTADKGALLMEKAVLATVNFLEEFATWPLPEDQRAS
jgi:creatinine amidohydrolase/Fe(II)-dependent formamide hydrolase-like protein